MTNQNRPVYRYPPRSHASTCRCERCLPFRGRQGAAGVIDNYGIIGPLFVVYLIVVVTCFWPVLVWHGQTDTGGWRWDIHSTVAELTYVGVIAFIVLMCWFGAWSAKPPRPPKGRLRVEATLQPSFSSLPPEPPPAPSCQHLNAVMVLNFTNDEILAWLCPHCDTRLPEDFGRLRRPCCGTPHGLWHLNNCRYFSEWLDITGQNGSRDRS